MGVAQVNGIQNVERAQAHVHVRLVHGEVVTGVEVEEAVGWNLPRLAALVFAVQAEGVKIRIVAAEHRVAWLDVDVLVAVLQRNAVLALWRITY